MIFNKILNYLSRSHLQTQAPVFDGNTMKSDGITYSRRCLQKIAGENPQVSKMEKGKLLIVHGPRRS